MIKRVGWIALLVVAVACSKEKEKKAEGARQVAKPIDAALKSPGDLFTGTKVTMPEHVAKIRYGMPEADAKAAHPDVFAAKYGYEVPGFDGVETTVQIEGGRVYQTYMKIDTPQDKMKELIAAKWGPPTWETKNSIGAPEIYWDNTDDGLRLHLERYADTGSMVRFDPVMSADAALGSDPKTFGFEKIPLIGATQEDVMKAYDIYRPTPRKDDPSSITFSTHKIAGTDSAVYLDLRVKDGKITGYHVSFPPQLHDKLMPRLEQMFGKGKLDSYKLYTDFKGPPKVKAEIRNTDGYGTSMWVGKTDK
jgi:hypothetical protein